MFIIYGKLVMDLFLIIPEQCHCKYIMDMLEISDTTVHDIYITPSDAHSESDHDSGEEYAGGFVDNLNERQLRAEASLVHEQQLDIASSSNDSKKTTKRISCSQKSLIPYKLEKSNFEPSVVQEIYESQYRYQTYQGKVQSIVQLFF